jgi:uncharacterized membrane protein YfcA
VSYSPTEIALVAVIMTLGSVVQGAVGFASGLLGVPLLVLSGFSLPEAATINLISTGVQNVTGACKLWSHLEPRELVLPVVVRWLALPCGVYVAALVDQRLDPAEAKQLVGLFLLVVVVLLTGFRVKPRETLNYGWQGVTFSISGFLMGFASIGGAPMVLYVNSLTWTASKARGFLFFCSASSLPVALVAFALQHGAKVLPAAQVALLVLPLIFAGLWLGLRLGQRLSKPLFRRITYGLIGAIAIAAIAAPWLDE